jgi:transcriptional regulator with XRE-family HTH domain
VPEASDAAIDHFYIGVGAKVRSARTAAKLSQSMLARRIGFTRSSIANLEAGRQRVALHLFVSIAQALDIEPAKLLPETPLPGAFDSLHDLNAHLADTPETTQKFVQEAVAQLIPDSRNRST